jgi:hypothetical protein
VIRDWLGLPPLNGGLALSLVGRGSRKTARFTGEDRWIPTVTVSKAVQRAEPWPSAGSRLGASKGIAIFPRQVNAGSFAKGLMSFGSLAPPKTGRQPYQSPITLALAVEYSPTK